MAIFVNIKQILTKFFVGCHGFLRDGKLWHRGSANRQKQGRLSGVGSGPAVPVGGGTGGDPGTNRVFRK